MATVDAATTTTEPAGGGKAAVAPESGSGYPREPSPPAAGGGLSCADLVLRALLFAATLAAVVVLVTAEQTALVPVARPPRIVLEPVAAKFKDSPALIYLLVASCVTCLYSFLTAISSLRKLVSGSASTAKTLFLLVLLDVFYAGVMASATGASGGVAWIGLKGNSHTRWNKICGVYDKFCRHIGGSTSLALVASVVLVVLAVLNAYSLYRRCR